MFGAKAILPIVLWCAFFWFLFTKEVHAPGLGHVTREARPGPYFAILLLNLAVAVTFTGLLMEFF
jgi:hypothetical protein